MTACDLIAFALLALLAGFQAWHHWILIARQHKQIRHLEDILALRDENPMVGGYLDQAQKFESRQNQPANQEGNVRIRPVS